MGASLNILDWHKLGLKVQGKWGDASHRNNPDRQYSRVSEPIGTYARWVVGRYREWSNNDLFVAAMAPLMLSKYGPRLALNFLSKSGNTMPFTIDSWNNTDTKKDLLIKAISEKVKGYHWKFHLQPSGQELVVNINDELHKNPLSFALSLSNPSEMIAIGGIQEINVTTIDSRQRFSYDYWDRNGRIHTEPHYVRIRLRFLLKDWFGVDEGDFANVLKPTVWFSQEALACFWILQHQRGYPPFITEWAYEEVLKIPVDKGCRW